MNDVRYVLDASALLAVMLGENGAQSVEACFADACVSAVNLSEVVAKLSERGVPADTIGESLAELDLDIRVFDTAQALRAGHLRNVTKAKGLSLGDRACLALAGELQAVAMTTDAAWIEIDHGIAVVLAR
jgi:ribonuclease VapC